MLVYAIIIANGLSYVVSIEYKNTVWCTFQADCLVQHTGKSTYQVRVYCKSQQRPELINSVLKHLDLNRSVPTAHLI